MIGIDPVELLLHVGLFLAEGWCARQLFSAFLAPRLPGSGWAVGALWLLVQMLIHLLGPDLFSSSLAGLFLYLSALLLFSLLWYGGGFWVKLFAVLQFTAIHELCVWAGNSLYWLNAALGDLLLEATLRQLLPVETFLALLPLLSGAFILLVALLREGMTVFFVQRIVKGFRRRQCFEREVAFSLLPAASGVLTAAFIRLLMVSQEGGYAVTLYESHPLSNLLLPLVALSLLAGIVFSFESGQALLDAQEEQAERAILETQVAQLERSLAETEHRQEALRALRHDMNNHRMVLKRLLRAGDAAGGELRQYMENLLETVEPAEGRTVRTGNRVSDAVIEEKFQCAEREVPGIQLDAAGFLLPASGPVRACDVGVILSNGLDNAIEACARLRQTEPEAPAHIAVRSFRRGKMLFIEIENSFDGALAWDAATGLPRSNKPDRAAHGVGLRSIRRCAQKYAGDLDCLAEGRTFTLSVMLKEA